MMRLLSDKSSRVYQRVGSEQDHFTNDPRDGHQVWAHEQTPFSAGAEDSNSWNAAGDPGPSPSSTSNPVLNGPGFGQYSTRSKTVRVLSSQKDLIKVKEANGRMAQRACRGNTTQASHTNKCVK